MLPEAESGRRPTDEELAEQLGIPLPGRHGWGSGTPLRSVVPEPVPDDGPWNEADQSRLPTGSPG